jgi:DNA-binding CsgD family transcriptional regulator/N-acetylneuraminic acid mutarotase
LVREHNILMTTESTQISDREREILRLVATGATNQQIANRLNISVNTVKVHLRNIFGKIGAASRTEATLYAVRAGLVPIGEATLAPTPVSVALTEAPAEEDADPAPAVREAWSPAPDPPIAAGLAQPERSLPELLAPPLPGRPARDWRLPIAGAALLVALVAIGAYWLLTRPAATGPAEPTASAGVPDASQRWHELKPMPASRAGFALASYTYEGRRYLYAIGGDVGDQPSNQVIRYEVAADTWVSLSAKPTAVSDVQSVVIGGKIYVPGGRLADGQISDKLESYDPQQDRWATHAAMPAPRSGYALAVVEGKLFLFGGWDGKTYRNEVWEYDPGTNAWAPRKPMPTARAFASATVVENAVYVVGGLNEAGSLATNERYIPAEDNETGSPWAVKAKLPSAADHMAVASINDQVFLLGGAQGANQLLIYTVGNDSWRTDKFPLAATSDLRAQAIGNKLYILGGRAGKVANAQLYEYQAMYSVLLPAISN